MSQIDVRRITQEYDTGDRRITALRDVSFTVGSSRFLMCRWQLPTQPAAPMGPPASTPIGRKRIPGNAWGRGPATGSEKRG
jgi:hypothetical protein